MDYGKFKYEEGQKAKEARKKSTNVTVKEVKYRPKIGKGDFDTKVRHMHDFLEDGHKVKVTLQFRGREMAHQNLGMELLHKVRDDTNEIAKVEAMPKLEGRQMIMMIAPGRKKPVSGKAADAAAPTESV